MLRTTLDDVPPATETPATSDAPALEPLDAYAVIATRDVFNPGGDGTGPAAAAAVLRLWGTGLHGGEARAVIEDVGAHRQDLYRVGDEVGGARIAAICLLLLTVLKCFLHDLARLGGLYRVASLLGLALSLVAVGVLLPAVMALLGERNWYLPKWLNRLPDLTHDESPEAVSPPPPPAVEGQRVGV